jgi:glutamyl-tRNA synthetase
MRPDGRFAPSPTGVLHVGNLRTALLAWLFARSQQARFVMRVEDLDSGRVRPRLEEQQLADLRAIGIDWDGPVVRQSERQALYADALERLAGDGLLYRCWCTRAEIREASSAPHGDLPEAAYPGTCRDLSAGEVARREASGRPPAWRVRAGAVRIAFHDRLRGEVERVVDDFVVRRNDGAYAYNLAVVVDDGAQSIGEVVRGADLLDSTPRQLWLGERLRLPAPRHAHVPLLLGPDGARLAKRHGAVTLADRAALGQSPDAVRRELLSPLGLGDCVTMDELVEHFDPERLEHHGHRPGESPLPPV